MLVYHISGSKSYPRKHVVKPKNNSHLFVDFFSFFMLEIRIITFTYFGSGPPKVSGKNGIILLNRTLPQSLTWAITNRTGETLECFLSGEKPKNSPL